MGLNDQKMKLVLTVTAIDDIYVRRRGHQPPGKIKVGTKQDDRVTTFIGTGTLDFEGEE
jgi:hypothetical protein